MDRRVPESNPAQDSNSRAAESTYPELCKDNRSPVDLSTPGTTKLNSLVNASALGDHLRKPLVGDDDAYSLSEDDGSSDCLDLYDTGCGRLQIDEDAASQSEEDVPVPVVTKPRKRKCKKLKRRRMSDHDEAKLSNNVQSKKAIPVPIVTRPAQHETQTKKKRQATDDIERKHRERSRKREIITGFNLLRDALPNTCAEPSKKLSEMDTLNSAMEYIGFLADILENGTEYCDRRLHRKYEKHLQQTCGVSGVRPGSHQHQQSTVRRSPVLYPAPVTFPSVPAAIRSRNALPRQHQSTEDTWYRWNPFDVSGVCPGSHQLQHQQSTIRCSPVLQPAPVTFRSVPAVKRPRNTHSQHHQSTEDIWYRWYPFVPQANQPYRPFQPDSSTHLNQRQSHLDLDSLLAEIYLGNRQM